MTENNPKRRRRLIAAALIVMAIYAISGLLETKSKQKRLDQSVRDLDSILTMLNDINHKLIN